MTQPPHGETTRASSIAAAEAPESDLVHAPPPAEPSEWPPVGAYPGEPGHPSPGPETAADGSQLPAADQPTVTFPAVSAADPADGSGPDHEPPPTLEPDPALAPDPALEPIPSAEPAGTLEPISAAEPVPAVAFESDPETEVLIGEPVWRQPPPSEPFHARHEKSGQWHTDPPEHLAWEHSPPAEVQPGVQHDEPTEAIPLSMLPHPWEVQFDPHTTEAVAVAPRPRHKRPFWIAVALLLTLLIFTGGAISAYLLLRDAQSGEGAPDPASAVNEFMTAVYTQQDPAAAEEVVCSEAHDERKLKARVDQIKGYADEYDAPSFSWNDPAVSEQTDDRATVGVQLTMTTDDEKTAQQQLTFTVIRKTGWLVCDVNG